MYDKNYRRLAKTVSVFLAAALVLTSVPAGAKKDTKKKVTQIQVISPYSEKAKKVTTTLTLKKGSTFKIKTSVSPKTASKKLVYKSSKKKIATVSKSGKIKAKKVGKTNITIRPKTNKKVKAVIKVTVVKKLKKVKKISLNKSSLSLSLNGNNRSAQLKASIVSPKKPTAKKFNWYSSNKKVVTVNNNGVVTAKATGNAKITVFSADGRGAKAVCKVTVTKGTNPTKTPSVTSSAIPKPITPKPPTPATPVPFALQAPGERTGIKQGESISLSVPGMAFEAVKWSVNEQTGVSISERGVLNVASDVPVGTKIVVTVTAKQAEADGTFKTDTAEFTVVENQTPVLTDKQIKMNQPAEGKNLGLEYRSKNAVSVVSDKERGDVVRVDSKVGAKNDMVAWMKVDPMYAGKTVKMSAYIKYDEMPGRDYIGLLMNENWNHSNPAVIWTCYPGQWYYISGTFKLPEYRDFRYDGTRNMLYLCRWSELKDTEYPIYYLDDLQFTVEKADVTGVTLTAAENKTEIYQNHTLQFSAEVTGTNVPMQKVNYSITPAVEGATIDANGLLDVKNVPKDTEITVRAVSYEDNTKFAEKKIKVLAQTVDGVTVSAKAQKVEGVADEKDSPTEIYAGQPVQCKAEVTSSGEPDQSVTWSVTPATAGVTISADGLLSVTDAVTDNTNLSVKATSKFDSAKSGSYDITVKKNVIKGVTVASTDGNYDVAPGATKRLYVNVEAFGIPSKAVTWSIVSPVEGVSITPQGDYCNITIGENVNTGASFTVKAVSNFDSSKYAEQVITVADVSSETKGEVVYYEDFSATNTLDLLEQGGVVSFKSTKPESSTWNTFRLLSNFTSWGIIDHGTTKNSKGLQAFLGGKDDYLQFMLNNEGTKEKRFTVSFMFAFDQVAIDYDYMWDETTLPIPYNLPLKLVAIDENENETILQDSIKIPFPCAFYQTNPEFYEIQGSVNVPAGKKMKVQLKLDGELPKCLIPDDHASGAAKDEPHPVVYDVDNISISTGENNVSLNTTDNSTYQIELNTAPTDEITYYTKSSLAKATHEKEATTCTRLTHVAEVSEDGLITAKSAGVTAVIVEIKHSDGSIERRQYMVTVS